MRLIITFFSMILLSSCAIVTKNDCFYTNWKDEGIRDGMRGADGFFKNNLVKTCRKKFKILGNEAAYEEGFLIGLKTYCSAKRARQIGSGNQDYRYNLCEAEVRPVVMEAYYTARIEKIKLKKQILLSQHKLIQHRLYKLEQELKASKIKNKQLSENIAMLREMLKLRSKNLAN